MSDPDLPGDADFVPVSPTAIVDGMWASVVPLSIEEQQAIHHNQLRYAELGKLRRGQPNEYLKTSYRH